MTWVLGLLGALGDFILKFYNSMKPPVVVTEAEEVGALKRQVQQQEATDEVVAKAERARDAVDPGGISTPGVLNNGSKDPDCRDC